MNAKISVFVICVEAIIYLLLYNLHDCTFKMFSVVFIQRYTVLIIYQFCLFSLSYQFCLLADQNRHQFYNFTFCIFYAIENFYVFKLGEVSQEQFRKFRFACVGNNHVNNRSYRVLTFSKIAPNRCFENASEDAV